MSDGWSAWCQSLPATAAEADWPVLERQADAFSAGQRVAPEAWWRPLTRRHRSPWMRLARALVITTPLTNAEWSALLQAAELRVLWTLTVEDGGVDVNVACLLAASSNLKALRALHLRRNPLGMAGASALHDAPLLRHLRQLSLRECAVTDSAVDLLSATIQGASLRYLDLAGNDLSDHAAVRVATSAHLRRLEHLDLSDNAISVVGARRLAASPNMRTLRFLGLSRCPIGDDGRQELYWSNHLCHEIRQRFRET